jgi:hypothetical protein
MTPPITSICPSTHPCPGELALDAPRLRRQATLLVAAIQLWTLGRHTKSRRVTSTTFHRSCRAAADAGIH